MSVLDHVCCSELAQHVNDLTTSGRKELDETIMKKVKQICRKGDVYIEHVYHLVMSQMQKDHSEIRYSSLLVVDELFGRSHKFRELLLADFQQFLELTAETDSDIPLPPPKNAAKTLKIKTLQLVQEWYSRFKDGYKRLTLGYNFLKDCKKVDFNDMEARSLAERRRQEMVQKHQEHIIQTKLQLAEKEFSEMLLDVQVVIEQMKNCFNLLLPHPDELFPDLEMSSSVAPNEQKEIGEDTLRHHGLTNRKHGIQIEIPSTSETKVEINEDTEAIIENLQDLQCQITTKYFPLLSKLLKVFSKASSSEMMKKSMDLKRALEVELEKLKELKIPMKGITTTTNSDDDDEFEEVKEKEGYEETASPAGRVDRTPEKTYSGNRRTCRQWEINNLSSEEEKDPTTLLANLQALSRKAEVNFSNSDPDPLPSTSTEGKNDEVSCDTRKSRLLTKAPRRPYDIDLYHWEEKKLEPPTFIKFDSLHKFWQPTDNTLVETQSQEGVSLLRKRVIEYSGEFVPVKWACRVPLPSGKLCPRQDRQKCPFHGPIIGRDKTGTPTNPEDIKRSKLEQPSTSSETIPEWQDPVLLKEIEAATGINLQMPRKGKRIKKKSDLTDVKKILNTARRRLEKKVFNKTSVKRVAQTLDSADAKRVHDKFGNQWNYAFNV